MFTAAHTRWTLSEKTEPCSAALGQHPRLLDSSFSSFLVSIVPQISGCRRLQRENCPQTPGQMSLSRCPTETARSVPPQSRTVLDPGEVPSVLSSEKVAA